MGKNRLPDAELKFMEEVGDKEPIKVEFEFAKMLGKFGKCILIKKNEIFLANQGEHAHV